MDRKDIPFSMGFVLKTTIRHMRKCIDTSISKTFSRIGEFDGNNEKSKEILTTLSMLHQIGRELDAFQEANYDNFKE